MNFIGAIKNGYRYAGDTSGRASRSEFWYFYLYSVLITAIGVFAIVILHNKINIVIEGLLLIIYVAFVTIPNISLSIRRLHDINKSGYWLLVTFIPIVGMGIYILLMFKSYPAKNKYGAIPKPLDKNQTDSLSKRKNDSIVYFDWIKKWALSYFAFLGVIFLVLFIFLKGADFFNKNKSINKKIESPEERACLSEQIPAMENSIKEISNLIDPFSNVHEVKRQLKDKLNINFDLLIADDNIKNRVLVAAISTSCKSKFYYLINIRDNENKELTSFNVYAENPPQGYSTGQFNIIESLKKDFVEARIQKKQTLNNTKSANIEDHCAPDLSHDERLRRLAKRGQIHESGLLTYTAGESKIEFTSSRSGSVYICY